MLWLFFCWTNVPIGILHAPHAQQNVIIIIVYWIFHWQKWQTNMNKQTKTGLEGCPNGFRPVFDVVNLTVPHNNATVTMKISTHNFAHISVIWFQCAFCALCDSLAMSINCNCADLWIRWFTRLLVNRNERERKNDFSKSFNWSGHFLMTWSIAQILKSIFIFFKPRRRSLINI